MLQANRPETYLSRMLGRDISQQEVAAALGVTRQTYRGRWHNGRLTTTNFTTLAQHFGVNLIGLLNWCAVVDLGDVRDFLDVVEGRTPASERHSREQAAARTRPTGAT